MSDQDPLVSGTIRRRVDAFTGSDHYRFTIDGIEYDAHWAHDTRRLLDENARLNAELHGRRNLGVEYERLRVENIQLRDQLDAVRKIKPQRRNSAMVTSEQLATMHGWNDAVNAIREALYPCECGMTDPSTWEMHGGATEPGSAYEWNPDCPAHGDAPDAAPEMPRPPAQEGTAPTPSIHAQSDEQAADDSTEGATE